MIDVEIFLDYMRRHDQVHSRHIDSSDEQIVDGMDTLTLCGVRELSNIIYQTVVFKILQHLRTRTSRVCHY